MAKLSPLAMGEEAAEAKGMALKMARAAERAARERLAVNLMRGRAAGAAGKVFLVVLKVVMFGSSLMNGGWFVVW